MANHVGVQKTQILSNDEGGREGESATTQSPARASSAPANSADNGVVGASVDAPNSGAPTSGDVGHIARSWGKALEDDAMLAKLGAEY